MKFTPPNLQLTPFYVYLRDVIVAWETLRFEINRAGAGGGGRGVAF